MGSSAITITGQKEPLVSVVMSTYNGEAYLQEQLDTITGQTYENLEIIIIDDQSSDGTVSILQHAAAKDQRIKLHLNPVNLGPNKSFEKGLLLATGGFIAISDQDDIWDTGKIRYMMSHWPEGSSFVYTLPGRFENNDIDSKHSVTSFFHSDLNDILKLIFNTPISGHACMFTRELMKSCLPIPHNIYYDWWISMHAAARGRIGFIPKTLSWQRIHGNNYSLKVYSLSKKARQAQLRNQWHLFATEFLKRNIAIPRDHKVLEQYAILLNQLNGKKFSYGMLSFILKHRKRVFHYKHKPLVIISHVKHAFRMARSGVI